jgi:hypothetical protein
MEAKILPEAGCNGFYRDSLNKSFVNDRATLKGGFFLSPGHPVLQSYDPEISDFKDFLLFLQPLN